MVKKDPPEQADAQLDLLGGAPVYNPRGSRDCRHRWLKERQRSADIATVKVGEKITRFFHGKIFIVECCDGYWRLNGAPRQFPTLYEVACEIGGKHERPHEVDNTKLQGDYSGARFFRLGKYATGER